MPDPSLPLFRRVNGLQLNVLIVAAAVVLTVVVVALVETLLLGLVRPDSMLVSAVSGLTIATLVVSTAGFVRARIAKAHRLHLEQGIARAQSHLSVAIDTSRMLYWEVDLTSGILSFDHGKLSWLGLAANVQAGTVTEWLALMHPEDHAPFMQKFQASQPPGAPDFTCDYRMQQASGEWGWVHSQGRVTQRNAQGLPLRAVGGTLNINQRKQAELALLENKERLEVIFNDNPDLMLISRLSDGCITEVNEAFVRYSGYDRAQAIGNTTLGLGLWVNTGDRQRMTDALRAQGRCDNLETVFYNHAGDTIECALDAVITKVHGVTHIVCIVRDISQRNQAQAKLQASETLLRTTLASTNEGILMVGQSDQVLTVNPKFVELWQVPPDWVANPQEGQLQAHVLAQLSDPADFLGRIQNLYNSDAATHDTLQLKDGRVFACFTRALEIADQLGRIWCFSDITKKTRDREAVLRSLNLLEAVINHSPIRIFWKDLNLRYLGCNQVFARDAGLNDPADVIGMFDTDFGWSVYAKEYMADDRQVLASGQARLAFEERQITPDGKALWLRTSKVPLYGQSNELIGVLGMYEDITERKNAERELTESEQRTHALYTLLRMVADNVPDMIWAKDTDKRYLFANKAVCEQLLMATDTDEPIGKDDLFFAMRARASHPDNPLWHTFGELCQDSDAITLQRGCASQFDEFGNVQGKPLYLDVHKAPLIGEGGEPIGVVGSARDVTAERDVQEKLRVAASVLANSSEALLLCDAGNCIVDINPAFTRLTGYRLDEVLGKNPNFLHSGKQGDAFYAAMWAQIGSKGRWQGEVWNRRKNGDIYAEWLTVNTLYHDDGSVHRRVGLFSDITEKKRSEELIWTQANFDALTGMPNRRMFLDRLAQDLKKAHRGGFKLALLFLDLDHFKEINDTLGHDVGDVLLTEAARRIAACTRESDTVARIGGDEFTVILAELTDTSGVDRIANDILNALAQPFLLGTEQAYVSVSIGITVYPDDALNQENLLKNADQAMYVSKDEGRNRFSYFTRAMQDAARHRQHLLSDLRTALSHQQFELHYQPIVDLRSGHIRKAEALLRWKHPTGRQFGPAEFIPLAEESGLIHAIGRWVFAQAIHQVQHWRTSLDPAFQVSVNLSPVQLQSGSELLPWKQLLQSEQLNGEAVVLEITEGLLLDKAPTVTAELLAYRDAGIQVAIDDFGTGYSALAYLTQLDIEYLKIDKSFVCKMATHAGDRALCEAIVVMAHKLGLKVIAEGVETAEQRDLLSAMGCDLAQGYLFAKALPVGEFEQWFAAERARTSSLESPSCTT